MNHGNSTLLSHVPEESDWNVCLKMCQFIPTWSGSDKPLGIWGMKLPQLTLLCCLLDCMPAKWKQFTLSKNAIYETVKYNYVCKPFSASSPRHLAEAPSDWGTECSGNARLKA